MYTEVQPEKSRVSAQRLEECLLNFQFWIEEKHSSKFPVKVLLRKALNLSVTQLDLVKLGGVKQHGI